MREQARATVMERARDERKETRERKFQAKKNDKEIGSKRE